MAQMVLCGYGSVARIMYGLFSEFGAEEVEIHLVSVAKLLYSYIYVSQ